MLHQQNKFKGSDPISKSIEYASIAKGMLQDGSNNESGKAIDAVLNDLENVTELNEKRRKFAKCLTQKKF